ncbi:MAG: hypothetical protein HYW33_01845 [Candidatus Blackburnbacteria bacterium]|nr:hypothetical protein [Candidatus Blackburnbacteria bacterium]
MDGASSYIPQKESDSGWETGLLFGGITLVLVIMAFFSLNYFNILSLSDLYPKTLGWLPRATSTSSKVTAQPQLSPKTSGPSNPSTLPLDNPLVQSAVVYYRVLGNVKKVTPAGDGFMIEVSSANVTTPLQLKSTKSTIFRTRGTDTSFDPTTIKPTEEVELLVVEDLKTKSIEINQMVVSR